MVSFNSLAVVHKTLGLTIGMVSNVGIMEEPKFCNAYTNLVVETSSIRLTWNIGSKMVYTKCQIYLAPLVIPKEALIATTFSPPGALWVFCLVTTLSAICSFYSTSLTSSLTFLTSSAFSPT
jgi:hypothetical protein